MSDPQAPSTGRLVAPRAEGEGVMTWDISSILKAEARGAEVAFVTPAKAPELLATFNAAHARATEIHIALVREHDVAVNTVKRIEAEILIDEAPRLLKERGLATARSPAGSEDMRNALVQLDSRYQKAVERQDLLKAMVALIKIKAESINRSFSSVKALVGERMFNYSGTGTSAGAEVQNGIGTARYNHKDR